MKSRQIARVFAATLLVLSAARVTRGQNIPSNPQSGQSMPVQPIPPVQNANDTQASTSTPDNAVQAVPDTHVLSSIEDLGLGSVSGGAHTIFDPAFHVGESAQTGVTAGQVQSVTYLGAILNLSHTWKQNIFSAAYIGNYTLYRPETTLDQPYQDVSISQTFQRSRWVLRLRDDLAASPNASFGGLDVGGAGILAQSSLSSISSTLLSNETIATGRAMRLNNTSQGEVDYSLSPSSTLTLTGLYGLMHFTKAGYINSDNVSGSLGYDVALSAKDSLGVIYTDELTEYPGNSARLFSDSFQVAAGRKVTGRLALQASAGPQLLRFLNYGPSTGQRWSWGASTSMIYRTRLTNYNLSYSHGTNSGSGVFFGSTADTVAISAQRDLARFWTAMLNIGYSSNKSLVASTGATRYSNIYGGVTLGKQFGQHFYMSWNYQYQVQDSNSGQCPVASCQSNSALQVFGMTLDWHPRTITPN